MTKAETIKVLKQSIYLEKTMAKRPGLSASAVEYSEKMIDAYNTAIRMLEGK